MKIALSWNPLPRPVAPHERPTAAPESRTSSGLAAYRLDLSPETRDRLERDSAAAALKHAAARLSPEEARRRRRGEAAKKVEMLKQRIEALKATPPPADPRAAKALARQLATIARELKAAVAEFRDAGGGASSPAESSLAPLGGAGATEGGEGAAAPGDAADGSEGKAAQDAADHAAEAERAGAEAEADATAGSGAEDDGNAPGAARESEDGGADGGPVVAIAHRGAEGSDGAQRFATDRDAALRDEARDFANKVREVRDAVRSMLAGVRRKLQDDEDADDSLQDVDQNLGALTNEAGGGIPTDAGATEPAAAG